MEGVKESKVIKEQPASQQHHFSPNTSDQDFLVAALFKIVEKSSENPSAVDTPQPQW